MLQYPIFQKISLLAKAGYGYVNYYSSLEYSGTSNDFIEGNDSGSGLAYSAGLNYQNNHHGISVYYDVFPTLNFEDNDKVKTTGYGVLYRYKF